ncbi:MAG: MFS transporter [Dehalococcoidia bacterium]|nr:MFS transporter [Dehalococcoidia bacterium]
MRISHRLPNFTRTHRGVVVLCVAIFFSLLSQGIITPVLPLFAEDFNDSPFLVGLAVGIFGFGRVAMGIPSGILAQRHGRRIVLVGGTGLATIGSIMVPFSGSLNELMIYRGIAGLGGGAYMVGAAIYLRDVSAPATRARYQSLQEMSVVMGVIVGPFIGGYLAEWLGIKAPLYAQAATVGVGVLVVQLWLPETQPGTRSSIPKGGRTPGDSAPAAHRTSTLHGLNILLRHPGFVSACLFNLAIVANRQGGRFAIMPLLGSIKGFGPGQLGVFLTVTHIPQLMFLPLTAFISDRFGRVFTVLPAAASIILGIAIFIYADNIYFLLLSAVFLGMGEGLAGPPPTAYVADAAPAGIEGITLGLFRTIGGAGFLGGALLFGGLSDLFGFRSALWIDSMIVAVASVNFVLVAGTSIGKSRSKPST